MSEHLRAQWRKTASEIRHLVDPDFEGEGFEQHRFEMDGGYLLVNVFPEGWGQDGLTSENPAYAVVDTVEVESSRRRQGVATRLFNYAVSVLGPIYHSEWQTVDGAAWADSVGGSRWGDPSTWRTEASGGDA